MSGLVSFFRGFLPLANIEDVEEDQQPEEQQQEQQKQDEYRLSISTFSSSRKSSPTPPTGTAEEEEPQELISLEQWKKERNAFLGQYMLKRLVGSADDENENDENMAENEEDDDDLPETQQDEPETQGAAPAPITPFTKTPKKRTSVPHVSETIAVVSSLDAIDLYSHQVNLGLLQIEKVWPLRRTHRRDWQDHHSGTGNVVDTSHGSPSLLPMRSYKSFEDDGPLGTLFRQAISIEVTQLDAPQTQQLKDVTAAAFGSPWKPSRMRVFFYGKYAQSVANFMKQHAPTKSSLLMSLANVPALCILPLDTNNTTSWFDSETLSDYCICIGDKSLMKMNTGGGMSGSKVRFDYRGLQIKLASCKPDASLEFDMQLSEWGELVVSDPTNEQDEESLVKAFHEWQKLNEENEEQREEEQQQERDQPHLIEPEPTAQHAAQANNEGPVQKKPRTEFHYTKLNELPTLLEQPGYAHKELHVFGTVLGFSSPTLTKRGDWMVTMHIVDETLDLPQQQQTDSSSGLTLVTLIVFCKNKEELPKPLVAGDVVRCHRVCLQQWQGDTQLVGRRKSSYVMVRPKESTADPTSDVNPEDWTVESTAKTSYTYGEEDHTRAVELWNWSQERILSYPTMMKPEHRFKLSDTTRIRDTGDREQVISRDLTVMISAIIPVPPQVLNGTTPRGFIRVWDGTGPPRSDPLPIATSVASESIKFGDPPSEALVSIRGTVRKLNGDDSENDYNAAPTRFSIVSCLEPPKCLCGCVVNVAIWEEPHWDLVRNHLGVGTFIRLRHVQENQLADGLRCLMVYSKSQLTPLPERTFEIRTLLEDHQKRLIRKDPYNPQSGLLPLDGIAVGSGGGGEVTDPPNASLRQSSAVARSAERYGLAKFVAETPPTSKRLSFRIIRTTPDVEQDEIGLRSLCAPSTDGSSDQNLKYQFAVHISDGSTEIDAIVSNDLAASLLGRTADEACGSSFSASQILGGLMNQDTFWNGTIRSVLFKGAKYFILESASIAKRGSEVLDLSSLPAHMW